MVSWQVKRTVEIYICATERAEQQGYSAKAETNIGLPLRTFSKEHSPLPGKIFALCRYCDGNHWSDQCMEYQTTEDRKKRIKDSCFRCLKQGHIAQKCLLNKDCIYCGRANHHHRSLCPKKFKYIENETAQLDDKEMQQIKRAQQMIITRQRPDNEALGNLGQELNQKQKEQLPHLEQQNDMESEHVKTLQQQLDQIKSDLSDTKSAVLEIKEQFLKEERDWAKKLEQRTEKADT